MLTENIDLAIGACNGATRIVQHIHHNAEINYLSKIHVQLHHSKLYAYDILSQAARGIIMLGTTERHSLLLLHMQ